MKFDVLVIGSGPAALEEALTHIGKGLSCAVIANGLALEQTDWSVFTGRGGILLKGDKAESADVSGGKVVSVRSRNLGDDLIVAGLYVLASGKYFEGGITADMDRVYEPVFGLDVSYEKDRGKWFGADFFAPQPFMTFGVIADADGHPCIDGVKIDNLLVKGNVLAGRSE